MRPSRSTAVASTVTSPAPDIAIVIRCCRCQSFIEPSFAEYWHMGETTIRFGSRTGPMSNGVNRGAVMPDLYPDPERWPQVEARAAPVQPRALMSATRAAHGGRAGRLAIGRISAELSPSLGNRKEP